MPKNQAKRASKWVFIGGVLKAPTPEAPYGRVNPAPEGPLSYKLLYFYAFLGVQKGF